MMLMICDWIGCYFHPDFLGGVVMARWIKKPDRQAGQMLLSFDGDRSPSVATQPAVIDPCPGKSDTSREAAARVSATTAARDRLRILHLAASRGDDGLTRDEISATLGISIQTVCPRVNELLALGHVARTSLRRPTRTGSQASVIAITPAGRREMHDSIRLMA